jgi:hypothetical protein
MSTPGWEYAEIIDHWARPLGQRSHEVTIVLRLPDQDPADLADVDDAYPVLNGLGKAGWELVSATVVSSDYSQTRRYTLKRSIPEPKTPVRVLS